MELELGASNTLCCRVSILGESGGCGYLCPLALVKTFDLVVVFVCEKSGIAMGVHMVRSSVSAPSLHTDETLTHNITFGQPFPKKHPTAKYIRW